MTGRRVALVTGGARGIGAAIATRLAADGNDVAVLDLNAQDCQATVDSIRARGRRAIAIGADVSDAAQVGEAIRRIGEELGPPLIVVNNAGVTRDNLIFRMSEDDWDVVIDVHLRGGFLVSRAAQAGMVEAKWGRIVNLSSQSALGNRGQANYAAAKAGIQGFTKTLAIELGPFGITANAVAPGVIVTDMTQATAERLKMTFDEYQSSVAQSTAVRRVGVPDDVAALVSYLSSEEAGFVSGQVIYVAGGPVD